MKVALMLFVLVTAAVVAAPHATADFNTGEYTHDGCPGTIYNRVDPINFVFWDWGTWDRAANSINVHAGWTNESGSSQTFTDHGNCYSQKAHRASAGATSTRFHIRLHPIHSDANLGWTTVGDAHHEDAVLCGHAVDANGSNGSGFDQGRRQLRAHLENAGHTWYSKFWGNTQNMQQCDGDYAGSDGYTVFSRSHQGFH